MNMEEFRDLPCLEVINSKIKGEEMTQIRVTYDGMKFLGGRVCSPY